MRRYYAKAAATPRACRPKSSVILRASRERCWRRARKGARVQSRDFLDRRGIEGPPSLSGEVLVVVLERGEKNITCSSNASPQT
jgi:hypothetical protein